jgi:hypothetical protein
MSALFVNSSDLLLVLPDLELAARIELATFRLQGGCSAD